MKPSISLLAVFGAMFILNSCSSKEAAETAKGRVQRILQSTTWRIDNVRIDGVDETGMFQDMQLRFSTKTYGSTNGKLVWKSSGTWEFTSDSDSTFLIDDDVAVTVDQIDEAHVTLSLFWDKNTLGGGRTSSISGQHVFVFRR